MEQRLKSGPTPRAWYREHAHTILLPLDEEESHLLRSLISAAKQFYHYLSLIHHALDGQEAAELMTIGNSLNGTKRFLAKFKNVLLKLHWNQIPINKFNVLIYHFRILVNGYTRRNSIPICL